MKKDIIINCATSETRIAILEDGRLVELFIERPENERMVGDIYIGRVVNVVKGMDAAFVDIGLQQDAFLHFSDVGETIRAYDSVIEVRRRTKERRRSYTGPTIREGQELLVQVTKEPIGSKGARVTTELSLPGRFLVLVPDDPMIGVSRKIANVRERNRLKKVAKRICPEGFGLIVRTVAEGKSEEVLRADLDSLLASWEKLNQKARRMTPPALVHKDVGMASSVIRDLFTSDINSLVIDSKKLYKEIVAYLKDVAPTLVNRVQLYTKSEPVFDAYNIEAEIEKSIARKVWLKSGGYIIVDHTEAMVVIDVNSGKYLGKRDHEQNILKINLEAAKEIARQLRLRDLGGLIVIDFIDMTDQKHRQRLYQEFLQELKKDRAQVNVAPISEFGLVEMTRERIRPSLLFALSEPCPTCEGTGRVISKSTVATRIERWLKRFRSQSRLRRLELRVHPEMADFLESGLVSKVRQLMWRFRVHIAVVPEPKLPMNEFRVISKKTNADITETFKA